MDKLIIRRNAIMDSYQSLKDGLIAHYLLNGDGNDRINGANLSMVGHASFNGLGQDGSKCYTNNDISSYAIASKPISIGINCTWSLWFKVFDKSNSPILIGNYIPDSANFWINVLQSEIIYFYSNGATAIPMSIQYNASINRWYHLVITSNNLGITMYIDGVSIGSVSYSSTPAIASNPIKIGAYATNFNFCLLGALDNIRVYDRKLSEDEVVSLYSLER